MIFFCIATCLIGFVAILNILYVFIKEIIEEKPKAFRSGDLGLITIVIIIVCLSPYFLYILEYFKLIN